MNLVSANLHHDGKVHMLGCGTMLQLLVTEEACIWVTGTIAFIASGNTLSVLGKNASILWSFGIVGIITIIS